MYISEVGVYLSPLPVLIGLSRGAAKDLDRRAVWIWVTMMALENFALAYLGSRHTGTWWITWFSYPLSMWLGLTALLGFQVMESVRRFRWPLFLAFIAVWLFGIVLREQETGFSNFAAPIHAIMLASVGIALLVRSGTHLSAPQRRRAGLTGLATALTYGPIVAVWPLSTILSTSNSRWLIPVWEVKAVFGILGLVLFCLALWSPEPGFGRQGASDKAPA